jgi:hypothetical protein
MEQFKISRALGLSFKSCFRNFIPLTLLAAVLYSPLVIWFVTSKPDEATDLEATFNTVFMYPIYFTIGIATLLPPLLTYRIIQELDGRTVSLMTSIKFGLRGVLPAIFLAVLTNIAQRLPAGGFIGAFLTCLYFVAAPAAVAEKLNPFTAFSRSAELTRGRRWGIFGLTILLGLMMAGLLLIWIVPMIQDGSLDSASSMRSYSMVVVVLLGVFETFTGVVQAVSYALLRQDKDGVSHADLARIFD